MKEERLQDSLPEERHTYYIIKDYQRMFNEWEKSREIMRQASQHIGAIQSQYAKWQSDKAHHVKRIAELEKQNNKLVRKNTKLRNRNKTILNQLFGGMSRVAIWWDIMLGRI